ncbi:RICIN domain-containing protein [Saccharothrix texasensis]|uniref:RICIN domain-containing protein n=1 Tax=Saccharothrix texasensis TaxID=103734 RepID=UPI001FE8FD12|nr:RICIN domain-containing protein [Saccharothrix texasensis]
MYDRSRLDLGVPEADRRLSTGHLIARQNADRGVIDLALLASPLGGHAREVTLVAGRCTDLTVSLPATSPPTGWHRLVNRASGKALDVAGASVADGAEVVQWSATGSLNQQWRFLPNADGSCRLAARHSGRLLDSPGGSGQGARLDQWQDTGSDNQWWRLVDAGGGYHRVVNVRTGLCVDVEGGSSADGARVVQWPVTGGADQEWRIVAG